MFLAMLGTALCLLGILLSATSERFEGIAAVLSGTGLGLFVVAIVMAL